jgi:two-component system NtrC family sensor kinase
MLLNRRNDVYQIIRTIGAESGVRGIRIYNKLGTIIFSTDSSEINKTVDMNAEACVACHGKSGIRRDISANERMRFFNVSKDERVLGLINPIKNEPDCYNSDCHAHQSNLEMLGVLDVMISMKRADETIASNRKTVIQNSVLITVFISLFSGVFILLLVNRPIKKLSKGIEEVGKGNLKYRIPLKSRDELGIIARQFNDMSSKLDTAYREIKDWSETLNLKVEQKTEELKNIYDQVVQIERLASLGKLSATVAHELNNPLEGILTYSKLIQKKLRALEDGNDYSKIIEFLTLIADESARCGKIVKDLLLFSHTDTDEFTKCELSQLIDKSITLINHHLEINNVKLIKVYPKEIIEIFCNSQKIQQALMSLLINAIESMPNGGSIKVDLTKENNLAVIRIKDEGMGIPEKDLPHIFEPFYSTKEAAKGTGLGLSIVYGIISLHNGHVEVEETSQKGTTFKITLPINLNTN